VAWADLLLVLGVGLSGWALLSAQRSTPPGSSVVVHLGLSGALAGAAAIGGLAAGFVAVLASTLLG
jgi:hypothetical protein